jgi:hypothetical protein
MFEWGVRANTSAFAVVEDVGMPHRMMCLVLRAHNSQTAHQHVAL